MKGTVVISSSDDDHEGGYDVDSSVELESFSRTMFKHNLPGYCSATARVYFPTEIWKPLGLEKHKIAILNCPGYGKRTWKVEIRFYKDKSTKRQRLALAKGWGNFAKQLI